LSFISLATLQFLAVLLPAFAASSKATLVASLNPTACGAKWNKGTEAFKAVFQLTFPLRTSCPTLAPK
jgi:hypothetical protein